MNVQRYYFFTNDKIRLYYNKKSPTANKPLGTGK